MNAYDEQTERGHLIAEASKLFPNASISIHFDDEDEAIYLTIDDVRYTFNLGSDDDEAYVFCSGADRIALPAFD